MPSSGDALERRRACRSPAINRGEMGGWVALAGTSRKSRSTRRICWRWWMPGRPALLPYLKKPATGQHADLDHRIRPAHYRDLSTLDWCKYLADTEYAADGYGHAAAKLWTAEGRVDCHEPADGDDFRLNQCTTCGAHARAPPAAAQEKPWKKKVRNCSTSRRDTASLRSLNGSGGLRLQAVAVALQGQRRRAGRSRRWRYCARLRLNSPGQSAETRR